ncbi:MAG TPA: hypothetical protein VFO25_08425 [Candidatus Eremiobacteraceae bacterium]|nr:hypothetical protein [Candidatus Eremiobacteraceae bacterium]
MTFVGVVILFVLISDTSFGVTGAVLLGAFGGLAYLIGLIRIALTGGRPSAVQYLMIGASVLLLIWGLHDLSATTPGAFIRYPAIVYAIFAIWHSVATIWARVRELADR